MYNTLSEVRDLIRETCIRCLHPEAAGELCRKVEFSNRMTRAAGSACFATRKIKLSRPLFNRNDDAGRRNTVIHEVCHILTDIEHPRAKAHGWEWRSMMRRAGIANPQRCHQINRDGLRRQMNLDRYKYVCPKCGMVSHFTERKLKNMRRIGVHHYRCGKCKEHVSEAGLVKVSSKIG